MAKYNLDKYTSADGLGFPLNFRRGNPNPLDNSSVWSSLEAAQNYAATDPVAYVGQILTVVTTAEDGTTSVKAYSIQDIAGTLKEVGSIPVGDGLTIEVIDGKIALKGASGAAVGAQPQIKEDGSIEWVVPSTETVEGLQTAVANLQNTVGDNTKGLVKQANDNTSAITAIKDGTTIESFKDVEDALTSNLNSAKSYTDNLANGAVADNTSAISGIKNGTEINDFAAAESAIAAAKKSGDDAQADVDALEAKVGTVTEGKTVVEMIADAQLAATYDDTELSGRVTTVEGKVTTLIGSDADKSVRTIANEELAAQLIPESAKESLDTLAEIAAWIQSHPDDASAMNTAITALQNQLSGIDAGDGTVKRYVDDAIVALKIGDYAKAADLITLAGRVTTLEGKAHIHSNKALLDTYTQTEADLADAVAKKHEHTNKTVLDGITAEKVTAWDKVSEKANDADLATIAKTGNVNDLIQTSGDVLVFNCGTSSTNI